MPSIVYPYNEILPKKTAHASYIFESCAALARCNCNVTLLCGQGSLPDKELFEYYNTNLFRIKHLPIIRKNLFHLSWNKPFFFFSQKTLQKLQPDWVFLSVRKLGNYHLQRKIPNSRYIYEVHELAYYPNEGASPEFQMEKKMLERADLITVTTHALKDILSSPPYSLKVPIKVIALAAKKAPLPLFEKLEPLILMYIGQLYEGQGIARLLHAISPLQNIVVKIIGGSLKEIDSFKKIAPSHVQFLGYIPPQELSQYVQEAHAFVAPFDPTGKMPYVAHTKLLEYAQWGRPIIAPDLAIVKEHFPDEKGVLLYKADSVHALTQCISQLQHKLIYDRLQSEISCYADKFTWEERAKKIVALL